MGRLSKPASAPSAGRSCRAALSKPAAPLSPREIADRLVPSIQRVAIRTGGKENALLRAPVAERAVWRDPAEADPAKASLPSVAGWKRYSVIDRLAKLSASRSGLICREHVRAADRYAAEIEMACPFHARDVEMGGFGAGAQPSGGYDQAAAAYAAEVRAARAAIGPGACAIVDAVVLANTAIKDYAAARKLDEKVVMGLLVAGLTRLVEHYGPKALAPSQFEAA